MRRIFHVGFVAGLLWPLGWAWGGNTNVFELKEGDRVLLVGDSLIERAQRHGYLEYVLTTRFPDRNVVIRHLGWSTDLTDGKPTVHFSWSKPPEEWVSQLLSQILAVKPTVLVCGYGTGASLAGAAGLDDFKQWLTRLLDRVRQANPRVRFILLSPTRRENQPPPALDPESQNEQVGLYAQALQALADRYDAHFVSFFDRLSNEFFLVPSPPLTENAIDLTDYGGRRAAEVLAQQLGWYPPTWRFGITDQGREREGSYGIKVLESDRKEDQARVRTLEELLVPPPWPDATNAPPFTSPDCRLQFQGMNPGLYELRIDGQTYQTVDAKVLGRTGLRVRTGPQFAQAQALLEVIRKKNELFSKHWLSQIASHLSQPRRSDGDQAPPALEIAISNPLIAAEEKRIAELKKPVPHTFELVPVPANQPESAAGLSEEGRQKEP